MLGHSFGSAAGKPRREFGRGERVEMDVGDDSNDAGRLGRTRRHAGCDKPNQNEQEHDVKPK